MTDPDADDTGEFPPFDDTVDKVAMAAFFQDALDEMNDPAKFGLPEGLLEAFRKSDLLNDEEGLRVACHFVNRTWRHVPTGETFSCSFRWIAGLLAKERNRIVASIQRSGDIFNLYGGREPEIYTDWYFSLYTVHDDELDPKFLELAHAHGWEPCP